jgi:predicted GTPase
VIGEAFRHKVLFVISQSDKTEPTSGSGQLSTAEAEYQPQNLPAARAVSTCTSGVCGVGPSAVVVTGDGRADDKVSAT